MTRECGFVKLYPVFGVEFGLDMGELIVVLKSIREPSMGELGSWSGLGLAGRKNDIDDSL